MAYDTQENAMKATTGGTDKPGFLDKLAAFAAAMDADPNEGIYAELKALRADIQMLAEEVGRLKKEQQDR